MLQRIALYLKQPYPFNSDPRNYMRIVAIFTFFILFFLLFFQPFGIGSLPGNLPIITSIGFALVTFFAMIFFLLLTLMFPKYFCDDNWTLGHDLGFSLINFIVIGHANYFYIKSSLFDGFTMLSYAEMMIGTFAVGFFPYTFLLLTKHLRMLRFNTGEAGKMNDAIEHEKEIHQEPTKASVRFVGENEGDELTIDMEKLLYVMSSGNYIEVVYNEGTHVNKTILRCSISYAEQLLALYSNIFRCHRQYLVNLDRIEEVQGNSQGYRLVMDRDVEDIPVARAKNSEFKTAFSKVFA